MKNLDILDKRIIECNGKFFAPAGYTINGEDFSTEFIAKRAKELGFVGRYRWGVEYKTDGKQPELADDVVVSAESKLYKIGELSDAESAKWNWKVCVKFKITDQRYKPTDTSYLDKPERFGLEAPESLNHKCSSSDVQFKDDNGADWYDYDNQKALRLPPVGVECEYEDSPEVKGYSKCTILAVLNDAFAFSRPDYKNTIFTGNLRTHVIRPLDFDRKAKAERKRVVDAVMKEFPAANELILCDMYGKGFLRLPD